MEKCLKLVQNMLCSPTLLHLRIPFSFFLLPVFLFALSISAKIDLVNTLLAFIVLHFFLYPASNGYNSYFDKDEKSIGGLENPPPVSKQLYNVSLLLDGLAIVTGLFISIDFVIMLLVYGLISKAYSHPNIRLKKMPFIGWFVAGVFQGSFTFLMVIIASAGLKLFEVFQPIFLIPAVLTTILLWGSYPMTQVYQHEEDAKRGDHTISRKLGIKGTFIFSGLMFLFADAGYFLFYLTSFSFWHAVIFQVFLLPIIAFFLVWFLRTLKDINQVNYKMTMRLNMISASCMNSFFLLTLFFRFM